MAFKSIKEFQRQLDKLHNEEVRKGMDRDIQAFAVSPDTFKELAELHISELRRLASRTDDPIMKGLLEDTPRLTSFSKRLQKRFIEIFEKNLYKRNKTLTIDREIYGRLYVYFIRRRDRRRTTGRPPFKILQEVLNETRKELINQSRKAGSSLDKSLSITVAGIDVDYDKPSAEVQQFYKTKELDTNPLKSSGSSERYKGAGAELGHTRGAAIVTADRIVKLLQLNLQNTVQHANIITEARNIRQAVQQADAASTLKLNGIVLNIARKNLGLKSNISIITLEQTALNRKTGRLAQNSLNKLRAFIEKNSDTILLGASSKPLIQEIIKQFETLYLSNKVKPARRNKTFKSKTTIKGKNKPLNIKVTGKVNKTAQSRLLSESSVDSTSSLPQLIQFLNSKLHDQIKENMGAGAAKKQLNYRTGRFAKSAKIETLRESNEKGAIFAQVKYLKYPYGVFEKGGRLHKPLRDPKVIFGRSIRQLLQQEKIAKLRRVIVETNG